MTLVDTKEYYEDTPCVLRMMVDANIDQYSGETRTHAQPQAPACPPLTRVTSTLTAVGLMGAEGLVSAAVIDRAT